MLGEGLPNHRDALSVLPGPARIAPGQDKFEVKLEAPAANGDPAVQTFTFHRGSYVIDVTFEAKSPTGQAQAPFAYFQLTRDTKTALPQSSWTPVAYTGPVVYNEADKFKKVDFSEIDKLAADPKRKAPFTSKADNGWVGMIEHYSSTRATPSERRVETHELPCAKVETGLNGGLIVAAQVAGDDGGVDGPMGGAARQT